MTVNIVETFPDFRSNSLVSFLDADTLLFFRSPSSLLRSDVTEDGTFELVDFSSEDFTNGRLSFNLSLDEDSAAGGNGSLIFLASENETGSEPWISDGTVEGTRILRDINPTGSSNPQNFLYVDGTFFFTADDGVNGRELWKSDGTEAGTQLVIDLDDNRTIFSNFTDFNGTLFFVAGLRANREIDLWTSDGTEAGTQPVTSFDLARGLENLTVVEDTLFFERNSTELWKSDGTTEGTLLVAEELNATELTGVGNTLFFTNDDRVNGRELWISDGTPEGTQLLVDIRPEERVNGVPVNNGSNPLNLIDVGGTLFFTADDGVNGRELWKSDGTVEGTQLVENISEGSTSTNFGNNFTNVDGILYFTISGDELWQSDGTAEGTFQVEPEEISVGGDNVVDSFQISSPELIEFNNELFFPGEGYTLEAGDYETALLTLAEIEDGGTTEEPVESLRLTGGTAQIAYVAYYGRPGDNSGLEFWNGVLADNQVNYAPREGDRLTGSEADVYNRIVDAFGNAAEADRIFGEFDNRGAVNQVYRFAFNRDGDEEGLDFWTDQIERGNVTLATFALEVALGAQNEDIVILNNKIESADLFTNSIDTPAEINAYQGSEAEIFGRNWLADYGLTVSTQAEVDSALNNLVG